MQINGVIVTVSVPSEAVFSKFEPSSLRCRLLSMLSTLYLNILTVHCTDMAWLIIFMLD